MQIIRDRLHIRFSPAVVYKLAVQPKDLMCDICLDVVTDLDNWITSETTINEIVHFMEGVSSYYMGATSIK